jgi:hypothetical protein
MLASVDTDPRTGNYRPVRIAKLAFAAVLGCLIASCGQGIPPAGNYATVSGTVVNASTGAGIAGANVSINGGVLVAQTDAGGNFHLTPVPTGDWDYTVSATGYASTGLVTNLAPLAPGEQRVVTIQLTATPGASS